MISIIIPVLNEERYIGKLLAYLLDNASSKYISEIIVIDGGSDDDTSKIVTRFTNSTSNKEKDGINNTDLAPAKKKSLSNKHTIPVTFLNSKKGRAKQMNFGAKHALSDILYFLHADSFPPKDFDKLITNEVNKGNLAGCFRMQFDSKHWWLVLASWFTKFSWRACRGGDQSQFITKKLFNTIGGFDENYIIYEDNILINALYARKQFVVINKKIKSSARMYKKIGIWKLQYIYLFIYVKKWLGADSKALYIYYKKRLG